MGKRNARRHELSRKAPLRLTMALTAVASLAACGGSASFVSLPPKGVSAGSAAGSSPATAATSSRQAVIAAYLAFWTASSQAEKTRSATAAGTILAAYVDRNYISYMITGMQAAWAKHEVSWGASVEHIQSVTIAAINGEQSALVKDCQDDSHDGLASAPTGDLLPGTLGSAQQELSASLSLINGRWLVEQVAFVGDTCTG